MENQPPDGKTDWENDRSSHGIRGLSPSWYLDPACFEFEQEKIFCPSWVPIGYQSQLQQPGDFFRFTINQVDCVAVCDKSKVSRAFQNLCRHRGTQLCANTSGHLNSAMVCPYHGWKYDFDGQLLVAPNMQEVDRFEKENFGLVEYPVKSWNGFLFVSQEKTSELPAAKLDPIVQLYGLDQYCLRESHSYDIEANWKLFFQNFNECYHCPSVHPQLTPLSSYRDSENEFDQGDVLGGPMKIRDRIETISEDGLACGAIPAALPQTELKKARYFSIFPNLFISFFPDYVMTHRLKPITKSRTMIECDFLFHPETIQTEGFDSKKVSQFWDLTNRQDWEMCERVQKGIATPGFHPSPYSNLESLLAAFDNYYLKRMSDLGFNQGNN